MKVRFLEDCLYVLPKADWRRRTTDGTFGRTWLPTRVWPRFCLTCTFTPKGKTCYNHNQAQA